ncbi:MAG: DUF1080 domain-containing protein [Pirellulaceae bacterium]|nr:DUF1080 domain-containing protein [Pirellulaceae bacterium]
MGRNLKIFCLGLALAAGACYQAGAQENNVPPEGFTALFNGKDLSGWTAIETKDPRVTAALDETAKQKLLADGDAAMRKFWRVEKETHPNDPQRQDAMIVNDGEGPYLTTLQDYSDFEMWIDYRTVPLADSGIYLKATPQIQIWDWTEAGGKWNIGADKGSGGLWNNSPGAPGKDPAKLMDRPFGEWNRFRIVQVGQRTSVWLNGEQVVDQVIMENYWNRALPLIAAGPIQLQTHGGEICWKNAFIRELSADEASQWLRENSDEGYQSVFNGSDLTGWSGPLDNYEIVDGAIRCRPGKGGTIYTAEEYGDFQVRFEFKLPPGGNNGLAIRYPGEGDTAYVGMCELQVLDSEHPKYANLDPRQYHGSAYGMLAAHRGYLRPVGEWNYQEVTVVGSKIKVELNGSVILDGDLAEVNELMADSPHPGKDRKQGHFGFAGHNDPVEFRKVEIKRLD